MKSVAPSATAVAIAKPARAAVAPPPPPAQDDDPLGAMYELADQANAAPPPNTLVCPQCRTAMDDNAVLCTNCGYDTRTGKSIAVVAAPKPAPAMGGPVPFAKKTGPVDYMAPTGSLLLGVVFSAVFALVASSIWIAVAYLTGFSIGYIAFLIGAAAGVGMQVGHKGYSKAGGVIAVFMTLVAIVVAKVVVLEVVLNREGKSISDLNGAVLGYYFFSPIGLIIIAVGLGAAYRTANGSSR